MPQILGTSEKIWPFIPNTLPKCSLWLDASDTTTMTFSSGCNVTQWNDKSGSGNNVIGTGTKSGNAITFNGSTQAFSNTSYVFPYLAYSIFMVYSNTTVPAGNSYMNALYGASGYPMVGVYSSAPGVGGPGGTQLIPTSGTLPSGRQNYQGTTINSNGTVMTASINFAGTTYKSADSGATWTTGGTYSGGPSCWVASPNGTYMAFSGNYTVGYSANGGSTWTSNTYMSGIGNTLSIAISSNGQTMLSHIFYGQIYATFNAGSSWAILSGLPTNVYRCVAMSYDATRMFVCGSYNPGINYSSNSGTTWVAAAGLLNQQNTFYCIACSSTGLNVVAGSYDSVWRSTDYGANWTQLSGSFVGIPFNSIASSADGTRLAGMANGPPMYVSSNSGSTWIAVTLYSPLTNQYYYDHAISMSGDGLTILTATSTNSGANSGYLVVTKFTSVVPGVSGLSALASSANTGALTPIATTTTSNIVSVVYAPSTLYPYVNGSAETTLTGTTASTTGLYIGGPTNRFNGSISEILVYETNLTDSQRQAAEGYLSKKWSVTFPATGHPFYTFKPFNRAFSILEIGTCSLWLDASDTSSMNSTPSVTSWSDKSGLGNTMTGSGTLSGNSMTFNGSTNGFSNTTYVFPYGAYTMFAVFSNTTAPGSLAYMNVIYATGGYPAIGVYDVNKYVYASSVSGNQAALSPNVAASSNVLVSGIYAPSTFSPFVNGSNKTALSGTTAAATGIYVGGPTNRFNGSISELIIFNSTLTTGQCQQVEGYLASKWNIQSNLVSTHSYNKVYPITTHPPQFQDVSPIHWKTDWYEHLSRIIGENNPTNATIIPTLRYSTATYAGQTTYSTVLAQNGNIYAIPAWSLGSHGDVDIAILNPTTETISFCTGASALSPALSSVSFKAAVLAPNGNIYAAPHPYTNGSVILVINTYTNTSSYLTPSFLSATPQPFCGGALAPNGNIYFLGSGTNNFMIVNPSTNAATLVTTTLSPALNTQAYNALVLGPNGKLYGIPKTASNILIINPADNSAMYGSGGPGLSPTLVSSVYSSAVLAPNGVIYCVPYTASNILMINTSNDSVSYGTGGSSLTPPLYTNSSVYSAFGGAALAANGNIYCMTAVGNGTPSNILIINPSTNAVSYGTGGSSLSPALGGGSTNTSPRNGCLTRAFNGNIFAWGWYGWKMVVISNTYTKLPLPAYCLSTYGANNGSGG